MIFIDDGSKQSEDLFLEYKLSKKKFIYLKYLKWDTNFFSKPSYILDFDKSNFIPNENFKKLLTSKFLDSFISVKLNTQFDFKYMDFLQKCGFVYIDTEVQLEHSGINISFDNTIDIQDLSVNKDLPYEELGGSFSLTRFHTDINITNDKADLIWIEYLRNFKPGEDKHIYVAKIENRIIGTALITVSCNIAYLFFIAVLKENRGLGVGQQLINRVLSDFTEFKIQTGTQVKNINALNFYIKNGFTIINSSSVLHRY